MTLTEEAKGKNLVFICGGIGLVPQRSFINYVLDHRADYGEVLLYEGRLDEAHHILATIYGWFSEGFDTVDLQEAKALLEELR